MTSSRQTALLAAALLFLSSRPCYAPTDWVVNTLDYANGLVKDASEVQEEYAGYANTYIQGKVGELGDVNAAKKKTEKARKIKERADKYKQKAEKMKALADKAKEKKAALQEKAKKLQDKADKLKQKYEAAQEKIRQAKDKVNEVKDKVDDVKDKYDQAKDAVNDARSKIDEAQETVSGLKDAAGGALDAAKAKAGLENDAEALENVAAENEQLSAAEAENLVSEPDAPITAVRAVSPLQRENAVSALRELAAEDAAVVTEVALPSVRAADSLNTELSADEVLKLAETPDAEVAAAETISEFNLEEQLLMSDRLKAEKRAETAAPKLSNEELRSRLKAGDDAKLEALRQSRRKSFSLAPAAVKEVGDE